MQNKCGRNAKEMYKCGKGAEEMQKSLRDKVLWKWWEEMQKGTEEMWN